MKAKKTARKGGKRQGAGRPALPANLARQERIAVRLTLSERQELERRANGEPLSEYLRQIVFAVLTA